MFFFEREEIEDDTRKDSDSAAFCLPVCCNMFNTVSAPGCQYLPTAWSCICAVTLWSVLCPDPGVWAHQRQVESPRAQAWCQRRQNIFQGFFSCHKDGHAHPRRQLQQHARYVQARWANTPSSDPAGDTPDEDGVESVDAPPFIPLSRCAQRLLLLWTSWTRTEKRRRRRRIKRTERRHPTERKSRRKRRMRGKRWTAARLQTPRRWVLKAGAPQQHLHSFGFYSYFQKCFCLKSFNAPITSLIIFLMFYHTFHILSVI